VWLVATALCWLMLAPLPARGQDPPLESGAVPGVIVALAAAARHDPGSLTKIEQQGRFGALLGRLEAQLDRLACDCMTRLAFNEASYVRRADAAARVIRPSPRQTTAVRHERPPRSELFVLEAIDGHEAAMLMSSVAPRRVSIVAVDATLSTRLIYDSFAPMKDLAGRAREPLLGIADLSVRRRGIVEIVEGRDDGTAPDHLMVLVMTGRQIAVTWEGGGVRESR
jgi:hypothetical protein